MAACSTICSPEESVEEPSRVALIGSVAGRGEIGPRHRWEALKASGRAVEYLRVHQSWRPLTDPKPNTDDHPIFLIGSGRCGTSLLRLLLDSSDEVAIGPESDLFWAVLNDIPEPLWNRVKCPAALVRRPSFFDRELVDFGSSVPELESMLQGCETRIEFLDAFFDGYRKRRQKPRWGEKTPMNLIAMEPILEAYPNAKFVWVARHPVPVCESFIRQDFGPNTLQGAAQEWYFRNRFIAERTLNVSVARATQFVRYEDLVERPVEALGKVFEFLEIATPAQRAVEQFHRSQHDGVYQEGLMKPVDPQRSARYATATVDRFAIESYCAELMAILGYEPSQPGAVLAEAAHQQRDQDYSAWLMRWLIDRPHSPLPGLLMPTRPAREPVPV